MKKLYTDAVWIVMHPYRRPSQAELNVFPGEGQRHQSHLNLIAVALRPVKYVAVVHDPHITGEYLKHPAGLFCDYNCITRRKDFLRLLKRWDLHKPDLVYTGFHLGWCLHQDPELGILRMMQDHKIYIAQHLCAYTAEDASTVFNLEQCQRWCRESIEGRDVLEI